MIDFRRTYRLRQLFGLGHPRVSDIISSVLIPVFAVPWRSSITRRPLSRRSGFYWALRITA